MIPIKNIYRIISILLILSLCLGCLGGCGSGSTTETTTAGETVATTEKPPASEPKVLKLPFSKAEALNPFRVKSMINQELCALIYDSLFRVDAAYKPIPVIAKDFSANGLALTVNIKSGLKFSDNSALNADDIIDSFSQAKTSPAFSAHLSNILSAYRLSDYIIVFNLRSADPYAVNCLDFAIVKAGNTSASPLGSGRYILTESKGTNYLKANPARLGKFTPKIKKITLVNITDSNALNYSLQIGNLSFAFSDLRSGKYQRVNASSLEVGLNNLVYLAFNKASANLKTSGVRSAVSLLIDRNAVAQTAFQGHARLTYSPFNPAWTAKYDFTVKPDQKTAVSLLEGAGFNKIYDTGVRYGGWGNALVFTLLVDKSNAFKTEAAKMIKSRLWKAGIKVNIKSLPLPEYVAAVKAGSYDMYLGETMLTPDMSLSPMLLAGGSITYGINTASGASVAYRQFLNGSLDIKGFVDAFNADMPFVPLCYRNGIAVYARTLTVPQQCNTGDVYCDISGWIF